MKIKPQLVVLFEQGSEESVRRLGNKRIDPLNGDEYNIEINPPSNEEVENRLIIRKQDEAAEVKKRFHSWN